MDRARDLQGFEFFNLRTTVLYIVVMNARLLSKFLSRGQDTKHHIFSTKHVRLEGQFISHERKKKDEDQKRQLEVAVE